MILPGGCWDTLLTMREIPESSSKEQLENRALEELSCQEAQEEAEVTQSVQIRDFHNAQLGLSSFGQISASEMKTPNIHRLN